MVTAIVIPIIIIYFYIISKRELQSHTEQWLALEQVYEEAIVTGKINQIKIRKERFYYHRYVHIVELTLINNQTTTIVSKITPMVKGIILTNDFQLGDEVRVYGNWKEDHFRFGRYEILQ
ncbi:hypothetical protein M3175_06190 [Robertmurraya korlensis]|uniref:hypothetical protein n=1 Tax=Robertmurraya korlensis TaxID=519977 RepID=UPI00203EF583|nr:hypothetical protein [Robertmurraya korlensis]MCM3600315.1 hypothetical protein [Robertmurraya korlensis]